MKNKIIKRIKYKQRDFVSSVVCVFLVASLIITFVFFNHRHDIKAESTLSDKNLITMSGDVMLSRYITYDYMRQGNAYYFEHVQDIFDNSHIVVSNIETSIVNDLNSEYQIDGRSRFNLGIDKDTFENLTKSGINVFSFANNHVGDYGYRGMMETLEILDDFDVDSVGIYENAKVDQLYHTEMINESKVALISVNDVLDVKQYKPNIKDNHVGIISSRVNEELLIQTIEQARLDADIVIIYVHWGDEYQQDINERQAYLSNLFQSLEVDLVVGHHPHVLQPITVNHGLLNINSLGNFVFDQVQGDSSLSALLSIEIEGDSIVSLRFRPLAIVDSRPTLANALQRKRIYKRLFKYVDEEYVTEDENGDFIVQLGWLND